MRPVCESGNGAISVQYERKTQLARLTRIPHKSAEATEGVLRELIKIMFKSCVKSVTFERGSEGANHWKFRLEYGVDTYHCDPYCTWQKGGVENLNGLIRQYLPKGTDLKIITDRQINEIEEKLNDRPRKSFNYKTPQRVLQRKYLGLSSALKR